MMGLLDRFKKQPDAQIQKSYSPSVSFADFIGGNSRNADLLAFEAQRLYRQCTPFYQSVNMRSQHASAVHVALTDTSTGDIIASPRIDRLLAKPNPMQTWEAFARAACSYYDICGETFFVVTLDSRGVPLEIYIPRPQDLVANCNNLSPFGMPASWMWTTPTTAETFYLDDSELGGSARYINRGGDRELWQWADFAPLAGYNNYRGMSKASPLWLQIQQFVEADTNNYSILTRGARPSVAWVWQHDQPMSEDQFSRWREQVKAYEGAANAGRQVLVDNLRPEIISVNNKDMEFAVNRKTVRDDIFSAYSIPLAYVSSDSMTMDNLKVSSYMLYDLAVLPLLNNLLSELSQLLLPRYRELEGAELGYSEYDIPALRSRSTDIALESSKVGVLSDNELRTMMGYEESAGGDVIYKPSTMVPAGTDTDTADNIDPKALQADRMAARRNGMIKHLQDAGLDAEYIKAVMAGESLPVDSANG